MAAPLLVFAPPWAKTGLPSVSLLSGPGGPDLWIAAPGGVYLELTGTPAKLRELVSGMGVEIVELQPGREIFIY